MLKLELLDFRILLILNFKIAKLKIKYNIKINKFKKYENLFLIK